MKLGRTEVGRGSASVGDCVCDSSPDGDFVLRQLCLKMFGRRVQLWI